jgi:DNA-binding PucR family transcriptional regulator
VAQLIAHADPAAQRVLAAVAGDLRDRLGALATRVDAAVLAAFPALGTQPDLRLALERSTEANLADVLAMLGDPGLSLDTGVPTEALSLAGMLVRRGVDPGDLVHAYLVAQNEFWRAWMEELAARVPDGPELTAALERSSDRVFTRADFLVAELMRQVDRERVRWMGGALARRTEVVQELLAGDVTDPADASRALGYDLDRWVLAAVLWERGDATAHDGLEARAAAIAEAAGTGRALTLAPTHATVWAWIGTQGEPDVAAIASALALAPGQGAAFGTPAHGLDGFRIGHTEATEARRIAELGGRAGVVRYAEIEAVSLLSGDHERLIRFVERTLGPLAAPDEGTARLRETLLAWLAEGGNARRAAERLHAHKNTVLYRLQRAQRMLDRSLDQGRGELELALRARDVLGARIGPSR